MEQTSYYLSIAAFVLVIICWFIFAGTFLLRKKSASAADKTSAPRSLLGIVLQGLGFGMVWGLHRTPLFSPLIDSQYVLNIVFQVIAVVLAAGSVWIANSAIRELGKQWSLQARLIEGHKLVTGGVYQIVRHPIYTAMLGKLLATGIIISHWLVVLIAVVIFIIGTLIRTRSEEKLLRDAFGKDYEEWAARVPGFIPFVKF
jgi:protein-S-isoprenylcysteine O-methyltransferase Ste14